MLIVKDTLFQICLYLRNLAKLVIGQLSKMHINPCSLSESDRQKVLK